MLSDDSRVRGKSSTRAGNTCAITGFTLIEIVTVMALIVILAASVLGITGYVQEKGKRSRAEVEIAAMSAALESYKADNGVYPRGNASPKADDTAPFDTDKVDASANPSPAPSPSVFTNSSFYLYTQLSGLDKNQQPVANMKTYLTFQPQMLSYADSAKTVVGFVRDPWGNSYGYSTAYQYNASGYNPTYDFWSTANDTTGNQQNWIKNW